MGMAFFSPFNTCTHSCSCSMVSFCIIDGALVCSSHMPEMATQVDESTVKLNPGVVGIAFAEQYYNTLSKSPELLHNFYNDSSLIGRPGLDGSVSSASTLEMLNVGCYNWVNPGWLAIYLCIVRGSYSRIVGGVVSAGCFDR
ncbi:uncharacterized protein [Populus alba]|uniref:uncharacterized protein isoform X2 n=1 Tax=Populus alba TaxID=43335 RepID=UPI003CC77E0B